MACDQPWLQQEALPLYINAESVSRREAGLLMEEIKKSYVSTISSNRTITYTEISHEALLELEKEAKVKVYALAKALSYDSKDEISAREADNARVLKELDQDWLAVYSKVLLPLLQEYKREGEECTLPQKDFEQLVLLLRQECNNHRLDTIPFNALLPEVNSSSATSARDMSIWRSTWKRLADLRQNMHALSIDIRCHDEFIVESRTLWACLGEITQNVRTLLGAPPCDFSLLLPANAKTILNQLARPLPFTLVITNAFYRHHPYFQALASLVKFSINVLADKLVQVDHSTLTVKGGVAAQWLDTPPLLIQRMARRSASAYLHCCLLTPCYSTNEVVYQVFQAELARTLIRSKPEAILLAHSYLSSTSATSSSSSSITQPMNIFQALSLWCQSIALYLNYKDATDQPLQNVPAILQHAKKEQHFAAIYVDELQRMWECCQYIQLCQLEHQLVPDDIAKELRNLERYSLQPGYQALPILYEKISTQNEAPILVDPVLFVLSELTPSKVEEELKQTSSSFTSQLENLATVLCQRDNSLATHVYAYGQIPASLRPQYLTFLTPRIRPDSHGSNVLNTIARFPVSETGLRPREPFLEEAKQWNNFVNRHFTTDVTESKRQNIAYLEWYDRAGNRIKRALTPFVQNQIFLDDKLRDRRLEREHHMPGQRLVFPIAFEERNYRNPDAYWKVFPQYLGVQIQATDLQQQLTGHSLVNLAAKLYPPAKADVTSIGIPVLISQPTNRDLVNWSQDKKNVPLNLEPRLASLYVLESILSRDGDRHPGNVGVRAAATTSEKMQNMLAIIDGDHAFQSTLREEKSLLGLRTQVKIRQRNILFCMPELMEQPLDRGAVEEFLALDPIALVSHMLDRTREYERQFIRDEKNTDGLFSKDELDALLNCTTPGQIPERDRCSLRTQFLRGTIKEIVLRCHMMQTYLRRSLKKQHQPPTALQVFKALERSIAPRYQNLLQDIKLTPMERFRKIDKGDVDRDDIQEEKRASAKSSNVSSSTAGMTELADFSITSSSTISAVRDNAPVVELSNHDVWSQQLREISDLLGNHIERRYEILSKILLDLQKGNPDRFLDLCRFPGMSYSLEQIIKQASKWLQRKQTELTHTTIGGLHSETFQKKLLEALVEYKHRFYVLHLSHWKGINDELLIKIAEQCKGNLRVLKLSGCQQITDKAITAVMNLCRNLTSLDVSGCHNFTDEAVRKIATHGKYLKKLNLSDLAQLRHIGQVDILNRPKKDGLLVFPALEQLIINDCKALTTVNIEAPKLPLEQKMFSADVRTTDVRVTSAPGGQHAVLVLEKKSSHPEQPQLDRTINIRRRRQAQAEEVARNMGISQSTPPENQAEIQETKQEAVANNSSRDSIYMTPATSMPVSPYLSHSVSLNRDRRHSSRFISSASSQSSHFPISTSVIGDPRSALWYSRYFSYVVKAMKTTAPNSEIIKLFLGAKCYYQFLEHKKNCQEKELKLQQLQDEHQFYGRLHTFTKGFEERMQNEAILTIYYDKVIRDDEKKLQAFDREIAPGTIMLTYSDQEDKIKDTRERIAIYQAIKRQHDKACNAEDTSTVISYHNVMGQILIVEQEQKNSVDRGSYQMWLKALGRQMAYDEQAVMKVSSDKISAFRKRLLHHMSKETFLSMVSKAYEDKLKRKIQVLEDENVSGRKLELKKRKHETLVNTQVKMLDTLYQDFFNKRSLLQAFIKSNNLTIFKTELHEKTLQLQEREEEVTVEQQELERQYHKSLEPIKQRYKSEILSSVNLASGLKQVFPEREWTVNEICNDVLTTGIHNYSLSLVKDSDGNGLLHHLLIAYAKTGAEARKQLGIIFAELLQRGCDLSAVNKAGKTPIETANLFMPKPTDGTVAEFLPDWHLLEIAFKCYFTETTGQEQVKEAALEYLGHRDKWYRKLLVLVGIHNEHVNKFVRRQQLSSTLVALAESKKNIADDKLNTTIDEIEKKGQGGVLLEKLLRAKNHCTQLIVYSNESNPSVTLPGQENKAEEKRKGREAENKTLEVEGQREYNETKRDDAETKREDEEAKAELETERRAKELEAKVANTQAEVKDTSESATSSTTPESLPSNPLSSHRPNNNLPANLTSTTMIIERLVSTTQGQVSTSPLQGIGEVSNSVIEPGIVATASISYGTRSFSSWLMLLAPEARLVEQSTTMTSSTDNSETTPVTETPFFSCM